MRDHIIIPHDCPHCGQHMNMISDTTQMRKEDKSKSGRRIKEGAVSVCIKCMKPFMFTNQQTTAPLTEEIKRKLIETGQMELLQKAVELMNRSKFRI